uniref:Small ribosomal subunit protein uS13c n=3 Tax=Karlodinium veneficum TaxID=407301 RepID=L7QI64_KARVE|nr:ribosomal protein S13 [Karlodinium veneficum]
MALRLAGVRLPGKKRVDIALTQVHGIGRATSIQILTEADIAGETRCYDLENHQIKTLRKIITNYQTEGDLRRLGHLYIQRLKKIKSFRGGRHHQCLPIRGQRSRTNAQTQKKKRNF